MIAQRTVRFTESVIREMTRLAEAHGAINLAQGFPELDPPPEMMEAAVRAIQGGVNQYAITWGSRNLRKAVVGKFERLQRVSFNSETEVTITCGSTEAMIATLLAIVDPGDEVIVFEPFYENYGPDTILSSATPRYVRLRPPDSSSPDWWFDPQELARAFHAKTKAIIINTPNNPTGKVFTREELELVSELCMKWDAIAVTDEIYEHVLYDGREHISMATLSGMRERTVTINAISKTYSATGWRVGWAIAPPPITAAIRKVHDFLTVGAPHPLQEAAAVALSLPASYYESLLDSYSQRREFLLKSLIEAGFRCWKPAGAYYVMTDYTGSSINENKTYIDNDVDFARWLVSKVGIAAVPGSSFYHDPELGRTQIRFSFGRQMSMLAEAGSRLLRGTR